MLILFVIALVGSLIGCLFLVGDNDCGLSIFCISFSLSLFFGLISLSFWLDIKEMKEKIKHPQYYSAQELSDVNRNVAGIRIHPFLYYGFNIDGIEYIELDSAGSVKIKVEE